MVKRGYDYMFYVFYRLWEMLPSRWWSDWKAVITMGFLLILLLSTISNIHLYIFKGIALSDYPVFSLILFGIIGLIHHFLYTHNDKWKEKIKKFSGIDKKKDILGMILVLFLSGLIIAGYIYSVHLIGTVDWENI